MRDSLRREWPLEQGKKGGERWPGVKKCGLVRCADDVEVKLVRRSDGTMQGRTSGICSCNSVHACPVHAAKILARYSEEVQRVLVAHGLEFAWMLTWTIRHAGKMGDDAGRMIRGMAAARRWFSGGREYQVFARAMGFRVPVPSTDPRKGWANRTISSLESTRGKKNGWHPHYHDVVLVDRSCDLEDENGAAVAMAAVKMNVRRYTCEACNFVARAGVKKGPCPRCGETCKRRIVVVSGLEWAVQRWQRAVELKIGPEFVPSNERALVVTRVRKSNYITKLGLEMNDPGMQKPGSPFGLAFRWAQYGDRDALRLFLNYATAIKGHKKLRWGVGLRGLYGLAQATDDQEAALGQEHSSQLIPGDQWDAVSRLFLSQLRLIEAAEKAGDASGAINALREMIAEVGARAGPRHPSVARARAPDHVLELGYGSVAPRAG